MLNDFLALLFPEVCIICNDALAKGERLICTKCYFDLPRNIQSDQTNPTDLHGKLAGIQTLKYSWSYLKFVKGGKTQKLLHNLKYGNCPEIGELAGKWFAQEILTSKKEFQDFKLILPVPLHQRKLRKRSYNQSYKFAQGISEVLNIYSSDDILIRNINNATQTNKSRIERWKNVEDIFSINQPDLVTNSDILLVDDVITTGSTLEACAEALIKSGSRSISVATIAVA
jgi:ComF family protein